MYEIPFAADSIEATRPPIWDRNWLRTNTLASIRVFKIKHTNVRTEMYNLRLLHKRRKRIRHTTRLSTPPFKIATFIATRVYRTPDRFNWHFPLRDIQHMHARVEPFNQGFRAGDL